MHGLLCNRVEFDPTFEKHKHLMVVKRKAKVKRLHRRVLLWELCEENFDSATQRGLSLKSKKQEMNLEKV